MVIPENTRTNAKLAINNMLFITMTSYLSYIMTSFSTDDVGWTGDQQCLDMGIQCNIMKTVAIPLNETEHLFN